MLASIELDNGTGRGIVGRALLHRWKSNVHHIKPSQEFCLTAVNERYVVRRAIADMY